MDWDPMWIFFPFWLVRVFLSSSQWKKVFFLRLDGLQVFQEKNCATCVSWMCPEVLLTFTTCTFCIVSKVLEPSTVIQIYVNIAGRWWWNVMYQYLEYFGRHPFFLAYTYNDHMSRIQKISFSDEDSWRGMSSMPFLSHLPIYFLLLLAASKLLLAHLLLLYWNVSNLPIASLWCSGSCNHLNI